jgi:flagellar basal body-associated protein FliL
MSPPPPPADDKPEAKPGAPAEADPFDNILNGGVEGLSLDPSGKGGSASALADAAKMAGAVTGGQNPSLETALLQEADIAPPAEEHKENSDSAHQNAATGEPAGEGADADSEEEGKEGESKARAAAGKVNSFIKSKKRVWSDFFLLFTGLRSADPMTARMSALFILSLVGAIYILTTSWQRHSKTVAEERRKENELKTAYSEELKRKLGDEEKLRSSILTMGRFTLELNPLEGAKMGHGIMNMAEVEIVLLCDSKKTREYIETHFTYARSLMVTSLVAMDREELLSHDGKKKWKAILMKALNGWLKEGQVVDLYYSKLIVN